MSTEFTSQAIRPGSQWRRLAAAGLLPLALLCGCSCMSPTDQGVLTGAGVGTGVGALLGHAVGHTGAGALIGAGLGAVTGGVAGSAVERAEQREQAALAAAAAARPGPLQITDVVSLAQSGVSDDVIIGQIHSTGSMFRLSNEEVVYLSQNHVSDRVIRAMQDTACRPPRVLAPVPVYQPVYVVEPPPPPVRVGFGVGFCR